MANFYFLNVGQGNMAVGVFPNNMVLVYDCNITEQNEAAVFDYMDRILPANKRRIDVFVNSHRDADHMRGIRKLHARYPINTIWDSGVPGNIATTEYQEYMAVKRAVKAYEVKPGDYWVGQPDVRIINGKRDGLNDVNSQSIVLQVNYQGSILLLAGDTSAATWQNYIMPEIVGRGGTIKSLVLYASHHGSHSFFNENGDDMDYIYHIASINPAIAIISVGANPHGHPDPKALQHYEAYCVGAGNGQKIFRTDQHGNMRLELHGNATGHIYWNH